MSKNEDSILKLLQNIRDMDYIKPDEIPGISLYMDQVTTLFNEHLESSKRHTDDKILTKTMINNYTKNKVLPPPEKKKYSRDHMLLLLFTYYLKNFLSISDVQEILAPIIADFHKQGASPDLDKIYREIFSLCHDSMANMTKSVIRDLNMAKDAFPEVPDGQERDTLTNFAFISLLSFDVYVKKMLIEKLLDEPASAEPGKQR